MWSHRVATAFRAAPVLALAASLLVSALGPPAQVGVAAEPAAPVARLQVVVKQIKIHDDRELFGQGEMRLDVGIWRCKEELPPPCSGREYDLSAVADRIARLYVTFGAGTDDTVTREWVVPDQVDGLAVHAGQRYVVRFDMDDADGAWSLDDQMGKVVHVLDTGEHGLSLGTHSVRSFNEEQYHQGDYTVTYEIRRAPVPDLRATGIKIHDLPGSAKKLACLGVSNPSVADAGPFNVALYVDGLVSPVGIASAGRLASGDSGELCTEVTLPAAGQHRLLAVVDKAGVVTEFNETNNVYEQTYTAPPSSTSPAPAPSQDQADLTVAAIRVRGQVPDGKDDCKEGRNDVAVLVKNGGSGKAGSFAVRLAVDGGEAFEESVADLDAGQEREVRFDDVRLRKGAQTLTAVVDAKQAVAESKEDNNERKVTANCKDDD